MVGLRGFARLSEAKCLPPSLSNNVLQNCWLSAAYLGVLQLKGSRVLLKKAAKSGERLPMAELYIFLKWLHIGSAAVAFGSNVTHMFWIIAANADPVHRANILRLVKKIDDRLAVPSYAILVACGVSMWIMNWPLNSSWIIMSLILTTIVTIMGISFGPFMNRWIRMARAEPADSRLPVWTRRLTIWWGAICLSVPVILYFMVFKPTLW
jgi:uncharacterized membrane protein